MADPDDATTLFPSTDGSADALLRECTADACALNRVFGVPEVVERLDTQFSYTMVARADRLFRLKDGSLWHVEWQSSRDPDMFRRMLDYWVFVRNKIDARARIRSSVVLVGKAPKKWVIEDWVGDQLVPIPVTDFRTLDVTPLFEMGNASDMLIGVLGKGGARDDRLTKIVSTAIARRPDERDRLISILGRMIELRGGDVPLPQGVYDMIEALDIDYERNPIFRRPFELGERVGQAAEKRRSAINLLNIARPANRIENEKVVTALPEDKIDALIAAVTNALTERTAEALRELETSIGYRS